MERTAIGEAPVAARIERNNALRAAVKARDNWWTLLFTARVANRIVGFLDAYPRVHPNHVTLLSLWVAILAGASFGIGRYAATVAGAALVQLAFIFDCVDGQLARYRGQTSLFGSILDRVFDRLKLPLYLMALAWGAGRSDSPLWIAAFIGSVGVFLVDVYRQQILLFRESLAAPAAEPPGRPVPLFLRMLDAPFVRLGGGDHYFLISLLAILDQVPLLLCYIAAVALAQILLRPLLYVTAFRRDYGLWPWHVT